VVPIGERAVLWVERYMDSVRPRLIERAASKSARYRSTRALFVTARATRMTPAKLTERLHRYLVRSGVEKPGSVHIFRHTMATLMHDAGADIRDLQEILGHSDLSTTEIYTHVSIERLKAVHARTHPAHVGHAEHSTRERAAALSS
jgi:integrase/recombinase XerD